MLGLKKESKKVEGRIEVEGGEIQRKIRRDETCQASKGGGN